MDYQYAPLAGLSPPTDDEAPGAAAAAPPPAAAAAPAAAATADRVPLPGAPANVSMTPAVALAAKQAQQESGMVAWVVCAWQLSNISDFDGMTKHWSGDSVRCVQL
jgi:hypothetical protein